MSKSRVAPIAQRAILLSVLLTASAPAIAGPSGTTGTQLRGPKAPRGDVPTVVDPKVEDVPVAFADFPDLPGLVAPPEDPDPRDREDDDNGDLLGDGVARIDPSVRPRPPRDSEQLLPDFPDEPDFSSPFTPIQDPFVHRTPAPYVAIVHTHAHPAIPAPGVVTVVLLASSMPMRRRRR